MLLGCNDHKGWIDSWSTWTLRASFLSRAPLYDFLIEVCKKEVYLGKAGFRILILALRIGWIFHPKRRWPDRIYCSC